MIISVFLALILVVYLIYIWNDTNSKDRKLPPSPSRLPIIGNIHHLIRKTGKQGEKKETHEIFTEISKKIGPLFSFWFGDRAVVFINDYVIARKMLLSYECSGRPQRLAGGIVSKDFQGLIVADASPSLDKRRSIIHQALNLHEHNNLIRNLEEEADQLLQTIDQKLKDTNGDCFSINDELSLFSINMFTKLLFNKRYSATTDKTVTTIQELLQLLLKGLTLSNLLAGFPALRRIPLGRMMFLDLYAKRMFRFMSKELDEHMMNTDVEDSDEQKRTDLTDLLLKEQENLTRDNIEVILSDMLVAGIDTSMNGLKLVVYNLAKYDETAHKCHEEVVRIFGDDEVTLEKVNQCDYIRAFVSESLRLTTLAPLGVPHKTMSDVEVDGYILPRNTTVFFNIHSVHNDEELFKNPELFSPERFLDEQGKFKNIDGFMGFSLGRRTCVGKSYATKTLIYMVAKLLKTFEITIPKEGLHENIITYETTLKMSSFDIRMERRQQGVAK